MIAVVFPAWASYGKSRPFGLLEPSGLFRIPFGLLEPSGLFRMYSCRKSTQPESTIDSEGFKGGTRGAPIMPKTQSLGQQMLNAPVGINGLTLLHLYLLNVYFALFF